MNTEEQRRRQRAIAEIRKSIPERLKVLDERFDEENLCLGDNDYVSQYAIAMTDLMFDVVGHAISYTDKVIELELLRERLQDAICTLDIAIDVWKKSEDAEAGADWHNQFDKLMHHH